jgi:hypothetical protein
MLDPLGRPRRAHADNAKKRKRIEKNQTGATSQTGARGLRYDCCVVEENEVCVFICSWRQLVVTYSVEGRQVHDARLVALMEAQGISHILTLSAPDFTRYPGINPIDRATLVPSPLPPITAPMTSTASPPLPPTTP